MVGYDAKGYIGLFVLLICHAGDAADVFHDTLNRVDLEKVVHPLHYAGKALKTHSGVDVGVVEGGVCSISVGIKLGEHKVPDLDIAVAVTAYGAGWLSAGIFFSAVEMYFRAWTAGAGAVLPEVILLAQSYDAVG